MTVEVKLGKEFICASHFLLYWKSGSAMDFRTQRLSNKIIDAAI